MSISKLIHTALIVIMLSYVNEAIAMTNEPYSRCSDQDVTYTVKQGDSLYGISKMFGSTLFWESLYVANADIVENPNLIYPGQSIRVPFNVAQYREKKIELDRVIENPFCRISELPYKKVEERYLSTYSLPSLERAAKTEREIEERNEQERMAEAVDKNRTQSQSDRSDQQEAKREDLQRESERQIMIEIDGMVHDDTRSKVGRDFYNVFYTYWQQPANARNFTIRISEQPSPNLGTTIYVTVNYTETFRMRLQPRYEMIEEAGKYAVRQTYAYLQNNYKETIIY
jgi:curli production assembly/transport component CsgE